MNGNPRFEPGWDASYHGVQHAYQRGTQLAVLRDVDIETGTFLLCPRGASTDQRVQTHRRDDLAADLVHAIWIEAAHGHAAFVDSGCRYLALPVGDDGVEPPRQIGLVWGAVRFENEVALEMPIDAPGWVAHIYSLAHLAPIGNES